VVIDVCLLFNEAVILFFNVFPFPVCKAQLICDWLGVSNTSANSNGAQIHPAPIVMADRTRKKIRETQFKYYWRTVSGWSGQYCLLAEGDISAPIFTSANSSVRLAFFHTNRLLTGNGKGN
jgi:hypothetical protein